MVIILIYRLKSERLGWTFDRRRDHTTEQTSCSALSVLLWDPYNMRWPIPSVPILQGQSRILTACPGKIMRSPGTLYRPEFRTANPVPILSRFECNVTSHVDTVYTYRPRPNNYWYTEFVVVRCILSSSKCTESISGRNSASVLLGELTILPKPPSRLGRGYPLPHRSPRRLWCLDLCAFGISDSVPIFSRRFMVTLI